MSGRAEDADEEATLFYKGREQAMYWWDGFVDFAFSGNILEIAFGLMLASAFTTVINSFVNHVMMPIISLIFPRSHTMEEVFWIVRRGPNYEKPQGYNTLQQAIDDGAVAIAYGAFLSNLITFFILGCSLYVLAQAYQWVSKDNIIKRTKKCKYCRKRVNEKALRCLNCTTWLDGREDQKAGPNLMDG